MWKFKASKYKNSAPKIPKKEEWLHVFVGNIMPSCGNHIKASSMFMAYNVASTGGGNLGVLPLEQKGRLRKDIPVIQAHSDFVTDMDFCPYDDLLLATASADCTVRLWDIPEGGLEENMSNPKLNVAHVDKKIENVLWHPTAAGVIGISFGKTVKLFDVSGGGSSSELYATSAFEDQVQSMSWKQDGSFMVTSCKDKMLRVLDPRSNKVAQEAHGHDNVKDSRALWLGNDNFILSCGFDQMRMREFAVRDIRNMREALKKVTSDASTGSVMPFHDPDTNMVFISAKGDTSIRFMEFTDKEPYLSDSGMDTVEQVRGLAMVPKRALDVMSGEVNRLLILGKDAIVSLPYIVPRKEYEAVKHVDKSTWIGYVYLIRQPGNLLPCHPLGHLVGHGVGKNYETYRDFHEDLFPDTSCWAPVMNAQGWFAGQNDQPSKINLNPAKKQVVKCLRLGDTVPTGAPSAPSKTSSRPAPLKTTSSSPTPSSPTPETAGDSDPVSKRSTMSPSRLKPEVTNIFSAKSEDTSTASSKPKPSPLKPELKSMFSNPSPPSPILNKSARCEERSSASSSPPASAEAPPPQASHSPFGPRVSFGKKATSGATASPEPSPVTKRANPPKALAVTNKQNKSTGILSVSSKQARMETQERYFEEFGVRQSKFRHWKGTSLLKQHHIENIRNLSKSIPGESNAFCANKDRCAVPLAGPGGLITILELDKPGRQPDTGVPLIQNGSTVMDFAFDPFDNLRFVTACDDARIRVWTIPSGGMTENLEEPTMSLLGHTEKLYFIRFHPLAKDVLTSASFDMTVRLWDLATGEEKMQLEGHEDAIFCLDWSPDGKKCATVCKDGKIRIYEPRKQTTPIAEGPGPDGTRGARVVWVCDGALLAVTGFDKTSNRTISVYDAAKLSDGNLTRIDTGTSPAILIPYYDEDGSTLFITARGESQVLAYEVANEHPYLFPLSTFKTDGPHQALAFLPKTEINVRQVEFSKVLRLTAHSIEPVSFTVPRVKSEYFQDDLFPQTRVTWESVLTSSEWFSGTNRVAKRLNLKPKDMTALSDAPVEAPKPKKYESKKILEEYKTDDEKKEELLSAMSGRLTLSSGPLPQNLTHEGVEDEEWSD